MIAPVVNLERQADVLARAQKQWDENHPSKSSSPVKTAWTIAITREAGAEGTAIAHAVGTRLHWPVYDRELVERIAREMGLRASLLESVDEKQKSWLLECVESMTVAGSVTEARFVKHLSETLLSLSALGHCVIVGRGVAMALPPNRTLRIRIVGNRLDRINNVKRRQMLSQGAAARWVDQTDRERVRFVMEHFNRDPTDCAGYHLVLNSTNWSVAECADFIVAALQKAEDRG